MWQPYRIKVDYACHDCEKDIPAGELVMESDRTAHVLCEECIKGISRLYDIFLIEEAVASGEPGNPRDPLRMVLVPPELRRPN